MVNKFQAYRATGSLRLVDFFRSTSKLSDCRDCVEMVMLGELKHYTVSFVIKINENVFLPKYSDMCRVDGVTVTPCKEYKEYIQDMKKLYMI